MNKQQTAGRADYLFIINPSSGSNDQHDLNNLIHDVAGRHKSTYRIFTLGNNIDPDELAGIIDDTQPNVVVACGGDGTVNLVAGLIMDTDIKLGIIPLGSANGMAYQLDLPVNVENALETVFEGKCKEVDLIRINGEHICLHMGDIGVNARVVKRYENEGIRGFYGYARQYFKELGNTRKFRCTVRSNREEYRSNVVMVVIANANHYGTGAVVNPQGDIGDGKFEVIMIRTFPFYFIFYLIRNFFLRRHGDRKFIRTISCDEAEISINPPQELQLDGEHLGRQHKINATVLPGKVQMITG